MALTCLCLQINNTVVFFPIIHTSKEIQSRNHVHSKPKVHQVYGVMPFYVSHSIELRTFIVEQSDSVNSIEKKKERERERERNRDRPIERHSLRQISCERLQVRNVEINFFYYILPENIPGKLSKQHNLM